MKYLHKPNQQMVFGLLCLVLALFIADSGLWAQERSSVRVRGVITDMQGVSLPGATVVIEGTNLGTAADLEGNFELEVNIGNTLSISFMSFETQQIIITPELQYPLRIILLPDVFTLREAVVVAVGYGTMRRSDLTGAISSIDESQLRRGVISSTEQILQGRVAGLNVVQGSGDPSSGSFMRLRGGTSLSASNSPLIVVDGIPGVDINTVHPNDIVSVDVLKDASAAAIYGSRGANGVIIITTKREETGTRINYSAYMATGQQANRLDLLSANQWRAFVRENNIANATDYGASTDWQNEIAQTSLSQSHVVSFQNVTDNSGIRVSINYLDNEGIIKRSRLERIGAGFSGFTKGWNNRLMLDAGINTNFDRWNPVDYRIFQRAYNLNPTIPVFTPDGEFSLVGGTLYENPSEILTNRTVEDTRNRLLAYSKVALELLPGLTSTTNLSFEFNSHKGNEYRPSYAVLEGQSYQGFARKSLGEYNNVQLESFVTYTQSVDHHRFNIMGGYSFLENVYQGFGAFRRGFDTDLFTFNNLGAGYDFRAGDVYSYKGATRLISFFGRANYSFQGKYMITATLRRDGSSRFGVDNRWGMFPSASAAWRISDEPFMEATSGWLDNLKLRFGFGVTGNQDAIPAYASIALHGASSQHTYYDKETDTWKMAYVPTQNPNPDLKWESTEQINLGLDFSVLGRLNGVVEVYQKTTRDLLFTYGVPATIFLYPEMLANVGVLSNKGFELTLNTSIMRSQNFSWETDFTFARNNLIVEKMSDNEFQTDVVYTSDLHGLTGLSGVRAQVLREGYPVGTFFGRRVEKVIVDGEESWIIHAENEALGDVQPDFSMGLNMYFTYKNFDASFSAFGMFGQQVLNATNMVLNSSARLPAMNVPDSYFENPVFIMADDRESPTGVVSEHWIEDASFMRLQTLTLGYTLPLPRSWFQRARLYVTAQNLFVITGYSGIDPEISFDGLQHPGIDMFNYYPKPRIFVLGLDVVF